LRLADCGLGDVALALFAPAIGSFLGVLVDRLPNGGSIVWSRSRCNACGTLLRARDLVPLFSWLLAQGRCRYCNAALGWFYPAIELAALAIALVALAVDTGPSAMLDCLFGWWLLALGWIDARKWLLPDVLTLPLIVAGLCEAALVMPERLLDRAIGTIFGYLLLRVVALTYHRLRRREGLGHGDAKLLAAAGAWVGAAALPLVLLAAASGALLAAAALALKGRRMHAAIAIPFGPFIAGATWCIWLLGA
jgi:leader peptidase (prepilin peptidase)/N-methyltransferase